MKKSPHLLNVIRLDSLPLNQTFFTPEGYLRDRPILTSIGIFEYSNPDGSIRRELRLPDEVFDAESLRSYQGKPIIITHDAGLVDKDNVSREQIGTILTEGYRSGNDVRADIVIHDTDEMKDCGLKELSLGYNLDLDETPGIWNGLPYDAIQRNIRINHLALVREARAGEQARLNIDGRDSTTFLKGGKKAMSVSKKKTTKTRRADGVLNPEQLSAAIEAYKAKRAARLAAKADEDVTAAEEVVETKEAAVDNETVAENATVEEKVEMVKDRRDRRDEEGDPATVEEAQGVIANQDEDIDVLFDIIDTLLAEKAFDEAEKPAAEGEETNADEGEETAEGEETNADEGEETAEEEVAADEDEEVVEGEETATDEGEETEEVAEDEDEEETAAPAATGTVNADSVDKIVRQRIKLGMIGRTLNLDGLEDMSPSKAKKAVIKAVRPGIRLDGKSPAYIQAMFDLACEEVKANSKKGTAYQKKQMFNSDGRSAAKKVSGASAARQRMIDRQHKVKEDK